LNEELSAERVARNDMIFRDANEKISARAKELRVAQDPVPFLCECADTTCTDVILLNLDEYARVRKNEKHFLNAPGHDSAGGKWAQVVEEHGTYAVVEKVGRAGEIVEREG
jgi:hypothetical protein